MTGRCHKTHKAELDLAELATYIAERDVAAAIRFLDAAELTCGLLARVPDLGSLCDFRNASAEGMRVWPVKGFKNHLIFYRPIADGIHIIRVLHSARDIDRILDDDATGGGPTTDNES